MLRDINPGQQSGDPHCFSLADDGTLFFFANRADVGQELWRSNGTAAGTVLVQDLNPGFGMGAYSYLRANDFFGNTLGNQFIFIGNDGQNYGLFATCTGTSPAVTGLTTSNVTTTSVRLQWDNAGAGQDYWVQWRLAGTTAWNSRLISTNFFELSGLTPGAVYDYRARTACNPTFASWRQVRMLCAPPNSLSSGTPTASTLPATWGVPITSSGPVYELNTFELRRRITNSGTWNTGQIVTGTSHTFTALEPGRPYIWQVRTVCAGNKSQYVEAPTPTTTICPLPPANSLLVDQLTASSARLNWQSVGANVAYEVITRRSGFSWSAGQLSATNSLTLQGLAANATYTWRVRSRCPSQWASFSTAVQGQFTTPTGGGGRISAPADEPAEGLQIKLLGNPIENNVVSAEVRGAGGTALRVVLYDAEGRAVGEQTRDVADGVDFVQLPLPGPAGIYLLKASAAGREQIVKVVKQ